MNAWKKDEMAFAELVADLIVRRIKNLDDAELNMVEASKLLGLAPSTIYKKMSEIPHENRNGRLIFRRGELLKFKQKYYEQKYSISNSRSSRIHIDDKRREG